MRAQVSLGAFYATGRGGLTKDEQEAARLYKLAADQGDAVAQNNLGLFYASGLGGLARDDQEAARLNKLAADQGDAGARASLGFFYSYCVISCVACFEEICVRSMGIVAASGQSQPLFCNGPLRSSWGCAVGVGAAAPRGR
jgi:Sel1 repeat-containing protein